MVLVFDGFHLIMTQKQLVFCWSLQVFHLLCYNEQESLDLSLLFNEFRLPMVQNSRCFVETYKCPVRYLIENKNRRKQPDFSIVFPANNDPRFWGYCWISQVHGLLFSVLLFYCFSVVFYYILSLLSFWPDDTLKFIHIKLNCRR